MSGLRFGAILCLFLIISFVSLSLAYGGEKAKDGASPPGEKAAVNQTATTMEDASSTSTGKLVTVHLPRFSAGPILPLNLVRIKSLPNHTMTVKFILPDKLTVVNSIDFQPTNISVKKGSIKFISEDRSITLLPGNRCRSKPGQDIPEVEMRILGKDLINQLNFTYRPDQPLLISLGAFIPITKNAGDDMYEYSAKYGHLNLPAKSEGKNKISILKIIFSPDFDGELSGWKYFADLF